MTGHRRETLAAPPFFTEDNIKPKEKKKKKRSSGQKRRNKEKGKEIEAAELDQININALESGEAMGEKKSKLLRVKKRKGAKINDVEIDGVDELHNGVEDGLDVLLAANASGENKKSKVRKKKRTNEEIHDVEIAEIDELQNGVEDGLDVLVATNAAGEKRKSKLRKKKRKNAEIHDVEELHNEVEDGFDDHIGPNAAGETRKSKLRKNKRKNADVLADVDESQNEVEDCFDQQIAANAAGGKGKIKLRKKKRKTEKLKKSGIVKGKELYDKVEDGYEEQNEKACKVAKAPLSSKKDEKLWDKRGETEQDEVYQISSGDEDCSRGMKKWTMGYYQSRPGLKILQQRIDDFITDHEEEQEKARKEREELAAEGGWTVVSHHKGRKKTADSESGITVGSVAPAAVLDKMAKKKTKEVGVEFYRFQKRDAHRNEIMMLQSKFEQDKKRIQQMRAARKFRPY